MMFDGSGLANACNPTDGSFPGPGNNVNGISVAGCTDLQTWRSPR